MSDDQEPIDLAFIGRQLQRLIGEVATLRDDVTVLAAVVRRIDNGQDRMLEEIRAMRHAPPARSDGDAGAGVGGTVFDVTGPFDPGERGPDGLSAAQLPPSQAARQTASL